MYSTISCTSFVTRLGQWAVGDNESLFAAMTWDEVVANFGGEGRLQTLLAFFQDAKDAGWKIFVVR
jgi:hypothetical protein